MKEKIFVGKFEFDQEELDILNIALIDYKSKTRNNNEICQYLLLKLKDMEKEEF